MSERTRKLLAAALAAPAIVRQGEELDHAPKEVDAAAEATASTPDGAAPVLRHVVPASPF